MNTDNLSRASSAEHYKHTSFPAPRVRSHYHPWVAWRNSRRRILQTLAERTSERQPVKKSPVLDMPVLDQPVPIPVLGPQEHLCRSVEARLGELEAAWAADRSVRWQ